MSEMEDLLAAKQAAEEALTAAEDDLLAELADAKEAYRDDPSPENRERHKAAVADVRSYREAMRASRSGSLVGGDAYEGGE